MRLSLGQWGRARPKARAAVVAGTTNLLMPRFFRAFDEWRPRVPPPKGCKRYKACEAVLRATQEPANGADGDGRGSSSGGRGTSIF